MNIECDEKDQKLAMFQDITHLDDFEQCQAILESTNWDIDQAVQSYFSASTETPNEIPVYEPLSHEVVEIPPSFSISETKRLIKFNIQYLDKAFELHVPENQTVATIKKLISEKIQVPTEDQKLTGWPKKEILIDDSKNLNDLYLPGEINLHVTNTSTNFQAPTSSNYVNGYDSKTYELNIKLIKCSNQIKIINQSSNPAIESTNQSTNSDRVFQIEFEPNTSFIEIRRSISKLTNTIANNQEWFYFKDENNLEDLKNCNSLDSFHDFVESDKIFEISLNSIVEDQTSLAEIKKNLDQLTNKDLHNSKQTPETNLIKLGFIVSLKENEPTILGDLLTITKPELRPAQMDVQENEDFEDITDDMDENFLNDDSTISRPKPLISSDLDPNEEFKCTNIFSEEFSLRYGALTPLFFIGSLEEAIQEALLCSAKERKLLGIYLHSDKTIFHNIFCSKALCDENVVNFLCANFVVWPWDLTGKKFEDYFNEKCSKNLGSVFTSSLRAFKEQLPVFLVVTRVRGSNEVAAIIQGDSTVDQMMNRLMQAYEMFEMQRISDERDEQSRDEREKIKREQDVAYQESLEADKAKRQRQLEEEEKLKREAQVEAEKERLKQEEKLNRKKNALEKLPQEPDDTVPTSQVTRIRFRLPDGEFVQRKFFLNNKLQSIIDFMTGQGFFIEQYKLLSTWPRKDLAVEDYTKSIQELKLYPQETLTLEERS